MYHRVRVQSSPGRNRSVLQLKRVRPYLELQVPRVDVIPDLTRMNKQLSNSTVRVYGIWEETEEKRRNLFCRKV
jgi:hypothetical protein